MTTKKTTTGTKKATKKAATEAKAPAKPSVAEVPSVAQAKQEIAPQATRRQENAKRAQELAEKCENFFAEDVRRHLEEVEQAGKRGFAYLAKKSVQCTHIQCVNVRDEKGEKSSAKKGELSALAERLRPFVVGHGKDQAKVVAKITRPLWYRWSPDASRRYGEILNDLARGVVCCDCAEKLEGELDKMLSEKVEASLREAHPDWSEKEIREATKTTYRQKNKPKRWFFRGFGAELHDQKHNAVAGTMSNALRKANIKIRL